MPELRSQYMKAMELPKGTGVTKRWEIKSNSNGGLFGWIRWYGPWRQYCFFPCEGTLYNVGCMAPLIAFLSDAQKEYKENAARTKRMR